MTADDLHTNRMTADDVRNVQEVQLFSASMDL